MCRIRFYFFPSQCSRVEREVIYVNVAELRGKEEEGLEANTYEKISEKKVINC
jgi:hypothetical protein